MSMNLPMVSVIIPNYNYADYIGLAIDSVLAQTYPNVEIVVVDDGSKDDSIEILAAYDGRIKLILQQNQGVSVARNTGAANSSGELLAFLDADDVWRPEKLEKQVHAIANDEDVGPCALFDDAYRSAGHALRGDSGWKGGLDRERYHPPTGMCGDRRRQHGPREERGVQVGRGVRSPAIDRGRLGILLPCSGRS